MFLDGMSFNVRGTTFKNEDGIDIQSGIKKVLNKYKEEGYIEKEDLYSGYTNSEIKEMDLNVSEYEDIEFGGRIKKDIYKGEECYKVYISKIYGIDENTFVNMDFQESYEDYFHIGYVPKEDVKELDKILRSNNAKKYRVSIKIVGGKYKHCVYDDYEDKEKVDTETLTYGFEVTVYTDDGINKVEQTEKEKQEEKVVLKDNNENNLKIKNGESLSFIISAIGYIIMAIVALPFIWIIYTIFSLFF